MSNSITRVHVFGEDLASGVLPPVNFGQNYDIAFILSTGSLWQKNGSWSQVAAYPTRSIGKIWSVGESIGTDQTVDATFGHDGDVIVYRNNGSVKMNLSGFWTQIWPT